MLLNWAAAPVAAATACKVSSAGCVEVVCTGAEDCDCVCICACALVEVEVVILSICRPAMLRSNRCDQTGVGQSGARRVTSMYFISKKQSIESLSLSTMSASSSLMSGEATRKRD